MNKNEIMVIKVNNTNYCCCMKNVRCKHIRDPESKHWPHWLRWTRHCHRRWVNRRAYVSSLKRWRIYSENPFLRRTSDGTRLKSSQGLVVNPGRLHGRTMEILAQFDPSIRNAADLERQFEWKFWSSLQYYSKANYNPLYYLRRIDFPCK